MKKFLALLLSLVMCVALVACGTTEEGNTEKGTETATGVKAGFICLHDENSPYDLNFINAAKVACEQLGVECVIKTNIPEDQACYDAAAELVDDGCSYVFADSFGHEDYMIQAAKKFPEVEFTHATGTRAHTEGVANYHNAFAAIYDGRYLAGIAAGMKLNEMIEDGTITAEQAKMGYVGAFTYAEVISGYTSFFLGARSVCPTATMEVTFTGSWYDEIAEKEGANNLINNGCVLISQHADSMGAPTACENAGVPNVTYNGSTVAACPNTYIVASRIDWTPYFIYSIGAVMKGESFDTDWCGTLETGSVALTEVNTQAAAEGTVEALETAKAELIAGTRHVYDVTTFTVNGEHLTTFAPAEATDGTFDANTVIVYDGYLHESDYRSAPYLDITIDGITLLDTRF